MATPPARPTVEGGSRSTRRRPRAPPLPGTRRPHAGCTCRTRRRRPRRGSSAAACRPAPPGPARPPPPGPAPLAMSLAESCLTSSGIRSHWHSERHRSISVSSREPAFLVAMAGPMGRGGEGAAAAGAGGKEEAAEAGKGRRRHRAPVRRERRNSRAAAGAALLAGGATCRRQREQSRAPPRSSRAGPRPQEAAGAGGARYGRTRAGRHDSPGNGARSRVGEKGRPGGLTCSPTTVREHTPLPFPRLFHNTSIFVLNGPPYLAISHLSTSGPWKIC